MKRYVMVNFRVVMTCVARVLHNHWRNFAKLFHRFKDTSGTSGKFFHRHREPITAISCKISGVTLQRNEATMKKNIGRDTSAIRLSGYSMKILGSGHAERD